MRAEGFTLLEMLVVLLIAGVLLFAVPALSRQQLESTVRLMERICLQEQLKAFSLRQRRRVEVREHSIVTEEGETAFPSGVACSPASWHYTPDGTISKGGTLTCSEGGRQASLVLRIGAGRMRNG